MPDKIAHIIHYCWFGGNPKPKLILQCIESWKKYMPDWKIKEWNESNYDVSKIEYTKSAYKNHKWAFVADYARFDILLQYGGIFFDTDVELIKPIPKELLRLDAFTGFEMPGSVAPGLIFASMPKHPFVKKLVSIYNEKEFNNDAVKNETTVDITTKALKDFGLKEEDVIQNIAGITIYPISYFCAFNHETHLFHIKENTIAFHHYAGSWLPRKQYYYDKVKSLLIKCVVIICGEKKYIALKNKLKGKN